MSAADEALAIMAELGHEPHRCLRCREPFGNGARCQECGVGRYRPVRRHRTRRIGGKRGRNSGKVSSGNRKSSN